MTDSGDFDEHEYLAANPDVKAAVAAGKLSSGLAHYDRFGRNERRPLRFAETRRGNNLLSGLDIQRLSGLEIGALDKPLVRKAEGNITYVDYADTAYLRDRYRADPNVDAPGIVDVDAIWGDRTLSEAVGADRRFDYVLASHVVEHVPDLVSWLQEIRVVLALRGSLRLAVPDKRYTFDYFRDPSKLVDVLDAYIRRARAPLPRMILDFCLGARNVDVLDAWRGPLDVSKLQSMYTREDAMAIARQACDAKVYHDVHCWVFTPRSFAQLMVDLCETGLIRFSCAGITDTLPDQLEFFVTLKPGLNKDAMAGSWARQLDRLGAPTAA